MEGVVTQIKDVPEVLKKSVFSTPVLAIIILAISLAFVLFVEAYKPGLFTGPIRTLLTKIGLRSA